MASSQHGRKLRAKLPPKQKVQHTDPSRFVLAHQKCCSGTFKQIHASGSSESFSCKLCESTYTKTWRTYNQFKFEGTLIQPIMPNTKQKETTTNA